MARRSAMVVLVALMGPLSLLAGCSTNGSLSNGSQVIVIKMTNMTFEPSSLTVHVGDTVTFRFVNTDTVRHEAVIGDASYQARHAASMAAMGSGTTGSSTPVASTTTTMAPMHGMARAPRLHPGMSDPNAVSVEPGATGELTFTFGKPTQLIIGCHEPGHYEAGMKAVISVLA